MLLLEANRIVSTDRLIEAVWGDIPPATAKGQIYICVSSLRRFLVSIGHPSMIATRPPGYLLSVGPDELDLHVYERLVAAGRDAVSQGRLTEARQYYERAVRLWSNQPLAGLSSSVLDAVATRLTERHLGVVEEYNQTRLELGDHVVLVDDLAELVAAHPFRERLHAQLMLANFRAGRRAAALGCYRNARTTLVNELGLEPGAELKRLEQLILLAGDDLPADHGEPGRVDDAQATAGTPHQLPAGSQDFTGRRDLLTRMCEILHPRTRDAHGGPVVVVSGGIGSGKSALALSAAHELSGEFPGGQLYASLGGATGAPVASAEVLYDFLRGFGLADADIPAGAEARAAIYRSCLAGSHVLVVLDDAVDERQVAALLPGTPTCSTLITSRSRLATLAGVSRVTVGPFDGSEAVGLLGAVLGVDRIAAEADGATELARLCDNWPLALRIVAARLAARPHWTVAHLVGLLGSEDNRLDELVHGALDVRTKLAWVYERLPPDASRLLRLLGVLGQRAVPNWVAGPLLEINEVAADELLETLADASLLAVGHSTRGAPQFALSGLTRAFARERFTIEEPAVAGRDAVVRVLSAWLYLAEEAQRRIRGLARPQADEDAHGWRLSPRALDRALADPVRWYEEERGALAAAVDRAAAVGAEQICCRLVLATAELLAARDEFGHRRSTHPRAVPAARPTGQRSARQPMAVGRSAPHLTLFERRIAEAAGRLGSVVTLLDASLAGHGTGAGSPDLVIDLCQPLNAVVARYEILASKLNSGGPLA
jgi:DNA-binding SARP family transcriptional activator